MHLVKNKFKAVNYLFIFLLLLWSAGFLFPILSPAFTGKPIINSLLNYNYSIVCHQSESSQINFGGVHLLICARCTGLYTGALFISIIVLFVSFKPKLNLKPLIMLSTPLVIDAIAVRLNIYPYSKAIAFITGILCGAIILFYILDAIENSINFKFKMNNELQ